MRRVKIESMEDMESLPEGKWVEAPVGLHAKFVYSVDRENNKLTITLPEEVAKRIGDRLCATFDGGKIVLSASVWSKGRLYEKYERVMCNGLRRVRGYDE